MTLVTMSMPIGPVPSRVRIAITSPDILAQIRQVFADNNLAVEIVRMPYIEVAVRPVTGAACTDRSAVGTVLRQLAGPASRTGRPAPPPPPTECRPGIGRGGWAAGLLFCAATATACTNDRQRSPFSSTPAGAPASRPVPNSSATASLSGTWVGNRPGDGMVMNFSACGACTKTPSFNPPLCTTRRQWATTVLMHIVPS